MIALFLAPQLIQGPGEVKPGDLARRYEQAVRAGEARWEEGNFEGARQLLETALELAQAMDDGGKAVECRMSLGRLCWALGRMEDSERFYTEAQAGALRAGFSKEAEECRVALDLGKLYSLGQAELFAGRTDRSIATFRSALALAEKIGSPEHELKCLRQLSAAHWALSDFEKFLSVNMRSRGIARELNDQKEKFKAANSIGLYYLKLSDHSRALDFYSEALDISRNARNKKDESQCLQNIGLTLAQIGLYERSFDYLMEAHEIDSQSGNPVFLAQNIINLGVSLKNRWLALSNKRDLIEALSYFSDALDWARRNEDEQTELKALHNIGNIHLHLGNFHSAQHFFGLAQQIAIETQDNEANVEIWCNQGIGYLNSGQLDAAQVCFRSALTLGEAVGKGKILWEPLFFLGKCHEEKREREQALESYKASLEAIEHLRGRIISDYYKVGFMKDKFKVYEAVIDHLWEGGRGPGTPDRLEEIFQTMERAKARAFLETLGEDTSDFLSRLNPVLEKDEREISERISAALQKMAKRDLSSARRRELQQALKRDEEEYLQLVSRMRTEAPSVANAAFPVPIRLREVQERLLDEKTAILEYFLGEGHSFLLLITKKSRDLFRLPPRTEIGRTLDGFVKLISTPPQEEWTGGAAARRLSQELLSSALKALPAPIDRLVIIPDGPLWHVPFESLDLFPENPSRPSSFLLSKYVVSYAPSCSALLFLLEQNWKGGRAPALLAVGDPFPPREKSLTGKEKISMANILRETYEAQGFDFSSLPQSGHEVKEIARYFPRNDRRICLHEEASEARIKSLPLEDFPILHFACHGFVDEKIPYRSSLVLSPDEPSREDGFLQVREITHLRLAAELVVLSACETGRGRVEQGEGILGLARGFFLSGARSVVSTLWKIGDRATARFMRHFYFFLSQGEDKAQALRSAKLRLLDSEYSHPFYWAPFELHGESVSRFDFRGSRTKGAGE